MTVFPKSRLFPQPANATFGALGGSGSPCPLFGPWRRADRRDQRGTEVFIRAANQLGGEVDGNSEADEPEHHASKTLYEIG